VRWCVSLLCHLARNGAAIPGAPLAHAAPPLSAPDRHRRRVPPRPQSPPAPPPRVGACSLRQLKAARKQLRDLTTSARVQLDGQLPALEAAAGQLGGVRADLDAVAGYLRRAPPPWGHGGGYRREGGWAGG
jgi:hypothetical protein